MITMTMKMSILTDTVGIPAEDVSDASHRAKRITLYLLLYFSVCGITYLFSRFANKKGLVINFSCLSCTPQVSF